MQPQKFKRVAIQASLASHISAMFKPSSLWLYFTCGLQDDDRCAVCAYCAR